MSVHLLPEPVTASAPPVFERPANRHPDTRPVEPTEKANTGSTGQQRTNGERSALGKAEPSPRPPGTDPSQPPQTFFDASLISASFKPSTKTADIEALSQPVIAETTSREDSGAEAGRDDVAGDKSVDASTSSEPVGSTVTAGTKLGVQQVAAYVRGSGGSPLTVPATANPDWLSSIEKIA